MRSRYLFWFLIMAAMAYVAGAQQATEVKKPVAITSTARLLAAKTAFVANGGGTDIPYNVISTGMEGWGRYLIVDSPAKADIIIEVTSPREGGAVSVTSTTTKKSPWTGRDEQSTTTSRDLSSDPIKLVVYDSKNKVPLWSASEQPKSAMRQKAREDNLVQAAERLLAKFRRRVEPE